jgi:hypothetical protein
MRLSVRLFYRTHASLLMGRWMEVLRERPAESDDYDARAPLRLDELAPHPLLNAAHALRSASELRFPALHSVRLGSPEYEGEELWLSTTEAEAVLSDLRGLRALCRRESFVTGLDGVAVYERWKNTSAAADFERHLDGIETALALAVSERGAVLLAL